VDPDAEMGAGLNEPTVPGTPPAVPTDTLLSADLAHLVADPAAGPEQTAGAVQDVLLPQDMLPGSREEVMSLREGLRKAGSRTFIVLAIITSLDYLQSGGLAVLAPNIQSSFHVSTGAITFVAGISGGFLVLGIVPMGWLADRYRRPPIVAWATFAFGVMVACTGFAINIFVFFLARLGAGVSQASTTVVHGSLLADTYPITLRGRIGAAVGMCSAPFSPVSSPIRWADRTVGAGLSTSLLSPSSSWPSSPFD
jgi:hypothetical protein